MDPRIKNLDSKVLLYNLYITQGILLLLGFAGAYFFYIRPGEGWGAFFSLPLPPTGLWYGVAGGVIIVLAEVLLTLFVPQDDFDDGGINEKIFRDLPIFQIALVTFVVGFTEELLFRGVMQGYLGIWLTSGIFTLVHIRYLKKWMMILTVFFISLVFGWLYQMTSSIWTPILAHFLVDFTLAVFIRLGWFQSEDSIEDEIE